jgi:hypothetical protein
MIGPSSTQGTRCRGFTATLSAKTIPDTNSEALLGPGLQLQGWSEGFETAAVIFSGTHQSCSIACNMQAARDVFDGHATVQPAGSVSKRTGLDGRSDFDFFVSWEPTQSVGQMSWIRPVCEI